VQLLGDTERAEELLVEQRRGAESGELTTVGPEASVRGIPDPSGDGATPARLDDPADVVEGLDERRDVLGRWSLKGSRPERIPVEIRHREPVTPSEELSDVEVAVDRDRRRRTEGELTELVTDRALPASESRTLVALDRRERVVEIVADAPPPRRDGVLGRRRARRRQDVASETWSRAVKAPSAAAGSIASTDGSSSERSRSSTYQSQPSRASGR